MSLVAFVSGRSPGLTTTVHALAATWPSHRRPVVAELDPAGGSLAARHELSPEPGLTNLAAAGRRGLNVDTVLRHCRRLPSGVIALVAPLSPDRVASALGVLGPELATVLASIPGTDVLADCGRIEARSPVLDLVRAAPYAVLVVTSSLEGVAYAQTRLQMLALPAGRLALVTIGDHPYRPEEVGTALGLPVLGALAHDRAGVAQLDAGRWRRGCNLRRSATTVSRQLAGIVAPRDPHATSPPTAAGAPEASHQSDPPIGPDRPPASPRRPRPGPSQPVGGHPAAAPEGNSRR